MQSLKTRLFPDREVPNRALLERDFEKLKSAKPGVVHHGDQLAPHPPIALALSGGGFRATLSALGVMAFLADAGLLQDVRVASSVSGGSIANGMLAKAWKRLEANDFDRASFNELVLLPIVSQVSERNLQREVLLNGWRSLGPLSLSDVLSAKLDKRFYEGMRLADIPPTPDSDDTTSGIRFIFNASDIRSGHRFGFRQKDMGEWDEDDKRFETGDTRLSLAVAASCAVPGVFAAIKLKVDENPNPRPLLVDGGVYDTLGLDPIDHPESQAMIISVDAGSLFNPPGRGRWLSLVPFAGRATAYMRSSEMMNRVNSAERIQVMVERFQGWREWRDAGGDGEPPAWTRRGVMFGLNSQLPDAPPAWIKRAPEVPEWAGDVDPNTWGNQLADKKASLKSFKRELCRSLVYRSWWLTGASLTRWHPELFDSDEAYPMWTEF